jgi:hypothetical protein
LYASNAPVREEWANAEQALAHGGQALRDAHDEQVVGLLRVELTQLPQQPVYARIVGTGGHQAQAEDSALREIGIGVVTEAAELVDHTVLRVGDVQQRQGQRHHAAHGQLAVVQQVLEGAQRHLRADLLA